MFHFFCRSNPSQLLFHCQDNLKSVSVRVRCGDKLDRLNVYCTAEVQPIIYLVETAPNYSIISVIWYTTKEQMIRTSDDFTMIDEQLNIS